MKFRIAPFPLVALPFCALFLFACVPAKEYRELDSRYSGLKEHTIALEQANDTLSARVRELRTAHATLLEEANRLVSDTLAKGIAYQRLQEEYARLQANYNELEQMQRGIMDGSQRETSKILAEIQRLQRDLQQREDALKELERQLHQRRLELDRVAARQANDQRALDSLQRSLGAMSDEMQRKNAELLELQRAMGRKDSLTDALRRRVADALFGFEGKGLTVHTRDGRVYVSLDEKLMFKTGSYEVDAKGREALRQLIPVLEQNPDIHVMVEGHTDDVPMRGLGPISDNWDLSVKRATSILRILLEGSRVLPARIAAAGRAEFHPLDAAKTAEARQRNRRTEIILTPKMDDVLKALGL